MIDDIPLKFGKYKGRKPTNIADTDPSYIVWLYENVNPKVCSEELAKDCEQELREVEVSSGFIYYL